jgi:hypothetical protein
LKSLLIIVGAGASYGAREPRPPLGANLLNYVRKYVGLVKEEFSKAPCKWHPLEEEELSSLDLLFTEHEKLAAGRSDPHANGTAPFERLVSYHLDRTKYGAHDPQLRALNRALIGALSGDQCYPLVDDAFIKKQDYYHQLIAALRQQGRTPRDTAFVSLNYDTLLEAALESQDAKGSYDIDANTMFDWPFYKLHGSINWMATSDNIGQSNSPAATFKWVRLFSDDGLSSATPT